MIWRAGAALILVALASGVTAGQGIELGPPLATGISLPVYVTHAAGDPGRLFVVEQAGRILAVPPAGGTPALFLDIRSRVLAGGERGLLGLSFHPDYRRNRRFFINYTRRPDGATVIAELTGPASGSVVANSTERVLMTVQQPYANHNGGMIEFGPDGLLYIGMGDGGSANDPENRAQNIDDLLGKFLRIDVDSPPQVPLAYVIPPSNPFAGATPGRDEIFATGFRNPWRFSFDRVSGALWAGDVGQSAFEEVDVVVRGGNFGWKFWEGTRCSNPGASGCPNGTVMPVTQYANTGPRGRCSVTGGYVYRGRLGTLPEGAYVYGDFCSGEIFQWNQGQVTVLLDTALNIVSFGEDASGEIYVVGQGGQIQRLERRAESVTVGGTGPGAAFETIGISGPLITGYARVQSGPGGVTPDVLAFLKLEQAGTVISETAVQATPLRVSGRLLALQASDLWTGVAVANPGDQPVVMRFERRNADGVSVASGSWSIGAREQRAAFLHEAPFAVSGAFEGVLELTAPVPVAMMAIRGALNTRGEFLATALPVVDSAPSGTLALPHVVSGGGWSTELLLINPADTAASGSVQTSLVTTAIPYQIPARGSRRILIPQVGSEVATGTAVLTPATGAAPAGIAVLSLRQAGVLVSESGFVLTSPAGDQTIFVESGDGVNTGVALWIPGDSDVPVALDLVDLMSGRTVASTTVSVGRRSYVRFLSEIFPDLPGALTGALRVRSTAGVTAFGLRGRVNSRGDFLMAAYPAVASRTSSGGEMIVPHFAVGGGYGTRLAVFASESRTPQGTAYFFDSSGRPLPLILR